MKLSDFDFELPPSCIANRPLPERDAARLLVLNEGLEDRVVRDLPELVRDGDVWVVNDTRVIPARLLGRKPSGGKVEILLLEQAGEAHVWHAWGRANKPLREGARIIFNDDFQAEVLERNGRDVRIRLLIGGAYKNEAEAIADCGHVPLPPYIDRHDTDEDKERYQTIFARHDGAVAAPTAGLHLTESLMEAMRRKGAAFASLTLHVGPGTFQPVEVEDIRAHRMHEEAYIIPPETARMVNEAKAARRRIVAVGTTSLRALEAAADGDRIKAGAGRTSIFIYPGYAFRIVDALLTNFHLPRSTLLMLVAAMAGTERVLRAYRHAIAKGYRFYSYGDAMFIPHRFEQEKSI